MRRVTIGLAVLGVLALAFISMPMRAQNQGFPFPGYPPEFAPSRTSRPSAPAPPRVPPNKFNRATRAVPNKYIVALNDDTPTPNVAPIATALAKAHGGVVENNWESLKAFSVNMPEAAAIALSNDPRVLYVEEDGIGTLFQGTQQPPLPWGLDRIDQIGPVDTNPPPNGLTNGTYTYPNDGTGVHVYVIDTGILASHHQFQNSDGTSRVSLAVDTTGGNGTPCNGHGTLVASIAGGNPPPALFPSEISYKQATKILIYPIHPQT